MKKLSRKESVIVINGFVTIFFLAWIMHGCFVSNPYLYNSMHKALAYIIFHTIIVTIIWACVSFILKKVSEIFEK
jgi:hypothetical protein